MVSFEVPSVTWGWSELAFVILVAASFLFCKSIAYAIGPEVAPTCRLASIKHFPFTKEGLRNFKHYALKRRADALKLRTATLERKTQRSGSESPDKDLDHQIDCNRAFMHWIGRLMHLDVGLLR
ncbi:hypothetical protein Tco_1326028 [Tanacetum coccineum]